jgi:hypothetical protein
MTNLTPVSIANAQGVQSDDSVFRSGGQTKQYPPRPRIAPARPRPPEERGAEQPRPAEPRRRDR